MNAIEFVNVGYTYGKNTPFAKTALDGASFAFPEKSVTGFIGHTGSGKSTAAQMMNGLLRPDSGEVRLFGENIWEKPKEIGKVRYRVGLVFQYPEYQLFEETVAADIAFGPKNMGLTADEIKLRVAEALDFVGLDESVLKSSPFDLSGGQKRRVAIAGIIAMKPQVLVLDEPAAGLDPQGREDILSEICSYREKCGGTVIIISHSMEDVARYCDGLVVMNDGALYTAGNCEKVFSDPDGLENIGLSAPQATKFIAELKKRNISANTSIYNVDGATDELLRLLGERGKK